MSYSSVPNDGRSTDSTGSHSNSLLTAWYRLGTTPHSLTNSSGPDRAKWCRSSTCSAASVLPLAAFSRMILRWPSRPKCVATSRCSPNMAGTRSPGFTSLAASTPLSVIIGWPAWTVAVAPPAVILRQSSGPSFTIVPVILCQPHLPPTIEYA